MGTKRRPPVATVKVSRSDGVSYLIDVQAPGAAVRFAVGTPDGHGFVWRLWSSVHAHDLYLAVRDRRRGVDSKLSFHASGDWRLQYEYSQAQALGVHRVLERWDRPAPADHGAIEVLRIMTPANDVVATGSTEPDAEKIIWVNPGPAGSLSVFALHLVPAGGSYSPPSNADLIAALQLADESAVFLLHNTAPLGYIEADMFQKIRQSVSENPPPGTPAVYVPRADPEYRAQAFMQAQGRNDVVLVDLLM